MTQRPEDICPRTSTVPPQPATPYSPPIYPASVWRCESTQQAEKLLSGELTGYVYQREAHPNADLFAEKVRQLHGAERAAVASSGMAAMAAVILSQLTHGDHVVASNQLYGRSLALLVEECARIGVGCSVVDTCDHAAVASAMTPQTKLVVVETISNPLLRVADIAALAEIVHARGARLLVDNTFATPLLCQPIKLGADLVMESVSKMMNGHSDVMLGAICGGVDGWERVPRVLSVWGLASSPFDCWLAERGLATMPLRVARASENALAAAEFLAGRSEVLRVDYPGLPDHPDHALARRQLAGGFGTMVTFHLAGGRNAADRFIAAARNIPFCPSLGEVSTTLSHPESTSHRGLSKEQRAALGISGGAIRLSLGVESREFVLEALAAGLAGAA